MTPCRTRIMLLYRLHVKLTSYDVAPNLKDRKPNGVCSGANPDMPGASARIGGF
jgi:hypothetical protein